MQYTIEPEEYMKVLWSHQLQKEYDQINWSYKLLLARPTLQIVDAKSYFGQWDALHREIKISKYLILNHHWQIVLEVLRHEIAHQLVTDRNHQETGHGPVFKSYCQTLGLDERFQKAQAEINLDSINFTSTKHYSSHNSEDSESIKLLERVEKLLSLAQSNNQNEALAAMEKVNELYEKYNLNRINEKRNKNQYQFLIIDLKSSKIKAAYSIIASILMEHYFVDVVLSTTYDPFDNKLNKTLELFGANENLVMAEYVFHFLNRIIEDLWSEHARTHRLEGKFKRSFQLGLLHGFNTKLKMSKEKRFIRKSEPESRMALKLLEENEALQNYKSTRYPKLHTSKRDTGRVYGSIYSQGIEDGKKIIINKGIENSCNKIGILAGGSFEF